MGTFLRHSVERYSMSTLRDLQTFKKQSGFLADPVHCKLQYEMLLIYDQLKGRRIAILSHEGADATTAKAISSAFQLIV